MSNTREVDYKNIIYLIVTFLACIITYIMFKKQLSLASDAFMNIISQTSIIFSLYDLDQATNGSGNEFAAMAAYIIPALQGIQIVTVIEKIVDHEGWINKILIWFSTLFLELFLGFTVQTYKETQLATLFIVLESGIFIYGIILTICQTRSAWKFMPVCIVKICFTNPISKYLWAYGIGFIVESFSLALLLEIPALLKIYAVSYIIMFVATPFLCRLNAWVVNKCLTLFFGDLYDSEDVCTLDIIGLVVAGIFCIVWIINITILG